MFFSAVFVFCKINLSIIKSFKYDYRVGESLYRWVGGSVGKWLMVDRITPRPFQEVNEYIKLKELTIASSKL